MYQHYGVNCFADDTGLEVAALDGRPGVHSAHYAGAQRNSEDNMLLLLRELGSQERPVGPVPHGDHAVAERRDAPV